MTRDSIWLIFSRRQPGIMNVLYLYRFILPLFSIVFWNLENHFDYFNGGKSDSDAEFSSRGARHWTKKRFEAKNAMIGKTILWSSGSWSGGISGSAAESALCPPAIVGIAEVENAFVLKRLCGCEVLRKSGYRHIHFESRDQRGIDVGLMYLPDSVQLVRADHIPIVSGHDTLTTRDILYAFFKERRSGSSWHFFVNHHPSKYGGKASESRRIAAMQTLMGQMDSLYAAGERNIVAMGDFNDGPDGEAFRLVAESEWAVNLGLELLRSSGSKAVGTIRYHGNWELIDNFIVSRDVAKRMQMQILRPSFLMERDRSFPGEKPRRTYIGPRYNGGVSDHLPILLFPGQNPQQTDFNRQ